MLISKLIIQLPYGLQARNTVKLLRLVSSYNSECILIKNEISCPINDDNIIQLMMLDIVEKEEIDIVVMGEDELKAMYAITEYLMGN